MRLPLRSNKPKPVAPEPVKVGDRPDFDSSYRRLVKNLSDTHDDIDTAMHLSVGGEFAAVGLILRDLLISQGLQPDGSVVDVGCGSGRLAMPLSGYLKGPYLGIDVVPDLVDYARDLVKRPDWRFELAEQPLAIPAASDSADIVCFFSVFTHLLHEESYRYLAEAKRVIRPGGRIIFSFLEFHIPSHWAIFEGTVAGMGQGLPLNQFMDREGIAAWADHLGLEIMEIADGDKPSIPLAQPVTWDSGQHFEKMGALGQSIAVLTKR